MLEVSEVVSPVSEVNPDFPETVCPADTERDPGLQETDVQVCK